MVSQLAQRRCHNVAARSKMRVVPTSVSNVVTTSLSDVVKKMPQSCYNVATTLSFGLLRNILISYPSSKRERVIKVYNQVKYIKINLFTMNTIICFFLYKQINWGHSLMTSSIRRAVTKIWEILQNGTDNFLGKESLFFSKLQSFLPYFDILNNKLLLLKFF